MLTCQDVWKRKLETPEQVVDPSCFGFFNTVLKTNLPRDRTRTVLTSGVLFFIFFVFEDP